MMGNNDSDSFFKRYKEHREGDVEANRVAAFEEVCVKKLLTKSGVTLRLAAWKGQQKREQISSRLTLQWLTEHWHRFPLSMAISSFQYPGKLPYAALLGGKISKLAVFRDYQTVAGHHGLDPTRTRFGMMFKCQRAKHATIQILHNQPNQSTVIDFDGTPENAEGTHCRRFMFWYRGINYVIEGIDSFVTTIGTDWTSDES